MFHWDLPQALEKQFGGWRDRKVVHAFLLYADTLVKAFRSRIKTGSRSTRSFFHLPLLLQWTEGPGSETPSGHCQPNLAHALLSLARFSTMVPEFGLSASMADRERVLASPMTASSRCPSQKHPRISKRHGFPFGATIGSVSMPCNAVATIPPTSAKPARTAPAWKMATSSSACPPTISG
jgi:hypothetical protein